MTERTLPIVMALGLVGCGGIVVVDPDGRAQTSGVGGSSSTAQSSTTTHSLICPEVDNEPTPGPVSFTARNLTGIPIYIPLQSCETPWAPSVQVIPAGGLDGLTYGLDPSCPQTCEDLKTQPPKECIVCAKGLQRLAPLETLTVTWDAATLKQQQIPAACSATNASMACQRILAPKPGDYSAFLTAISSCSTCNCTAEGVCFGMPDGAMSTASAKFTMPATNGPMELVFESCAFGCAGK
jgi:hypothetical protein